MTRDEAAFAVPSPLRPLVERIAREMAPRAVWLFGSHARGDARPDSDWDPLVVVSDDAPDALLDPAATWAFQRQGGVRADILVTRQSDLTEIWGVPNTLGYDLARHGRLLDVG
ncbi:nucleotidyltransferase domain-containing protein [Methylobacterium sp. JK268]